MNILVTGGAGFIGAHLSELLLEQGHFVYVIDDLSTGSFENIQPLISNPRFMYRIDTVMNVALTAELVDLCDCVIHLAAAVGVKLIVESPTRTIETNIKGTEVVLSLAAKKGKTVFIASTSEVYGKRTNVPFREDDDLILGPTNRGRWAYACSKAIDEFLALAYFREKKLPTIVARLFNTVGPRQTGRYGMVIPNFVRQALKGEDITVYGDGSQTRCFSHVHDVIDAISRLVQEEKAVGQVFNIGTAEEVSVKQLAERVKELARSPSKITYIPYEKAYEDGFEDMQRRVPDTSKLDKLIGFKPRHNLDQILTSVIDYERARLFGATALQQAG